MTDKGGDPGIGRLMEQPCTDHTPARNTATPQNVQSWSASRCNTCSHGEPLTATYAAIGASASYRQTQMDGRRFKLDM
jgi:hypothetical protein